MPSRPFVVTGANGNVGAPLVEALAARGAPVRAAVHGDRRAFDADVETVPFDFDAPETWSGAFEDARSLFVLRPPQIARVETFINPAIDAAIDAGVRHVVTLSVMAAGTVPFLPHRRVEAHVEASGAAWTHVRPGFFMQNLSGPSRVGLRRYGELIVPAGTGAANWVDARDVGELAAAVLAEGEAHHGQVYEPTGPRAVDYHEVAATLSDVLGREITYSRPGILTYVRHMMRDTDHPLGFILVSALLHTVVRLGLSTRTTGDVKAVLGRPPRSLRTFAEDYADVWD